jgi:acetyltransferase EpsM
MENKIILIGAGGNCKKIIDMLDSYNLKIYGILDDKFKGKNMNFYNNTKIIGKIQNVNNYSNCDIYVTIGCIIFRRNFFNKYNNLKYPNLIHKNCSISKTCKLGKGIIVHCGVYIGPDSIIEDFCHIDTNSCIEHDCNLGTNVMICPGVNFCGHSIIKNNVFIGTGTTVNDSTDKQIIIGNNCFVGSGSLIIKSVPDNILYYGTPFNYKMNPSPHTL